MKQFKKSREPTSFNVSIKTFNKISLIKRMSQL